MKAMIFAAGLGTRLRPLTDSIPKALVPVGGQPLIRHLIQRLQAAGYDEFVVNVHHFADKLEDYIRQNDCFGAKIAFSDERARLLDTGGGLLHACSLLEDQRCIQKSVATPGNYAGPDATTHVTANPRENTPVAPEHFLVHNVDILSNLDFSLLNKYSPDSSDPMATLVVSERKTSRYLLFDPSMRLVGWTNVNTGEVRSPYLPGGRTTVDPAALSRSRVTAYAFSGIHKISGSIFPELEKYAGVHGETFSIIDFYLSVCDRLPIYGLVPDDFQMIDVGKLSSLSAAEVFLHEYFV